MFTSEIELEDALATPRPELVADLAESSGDIVILGAGGKMGPSLSRLARNALDQAGRSSDIVYAVSRFSNQEARSGLEEKGVTTVPFDLLSDDDFAALPDAQNVVFMVGAKFGAATNASWAWEVNAALPDRVARRYRDSAITAMSTGNVYPFVSPASGGSVETDAPAPVGEYAMSCLGRERVFEFAALTRATPVSVVRLNYAIDLRYGVLADIASIVLAGEPVSLTTGTANVVWQGYANEVVLRSMRHASESVFTVNLTGPEQLSVRAVAQRFGELFDREVQFDGTEAPTALLNNAGRCFELFGYPSVPAGTLVEWQADWLSRGLPTSGKPTKWAVRDGRF